MRAVFDAHVHLFEHPYRDVFRNSHIRTGAAGELRLYEEYRKTFRVAGAFVLCHEADRRPANHRFVKRLRASRPWIHSFGHMRAAPRAFAARARALLADGHFGLACYLDYASPESWLASPEMRRFWSLMEARRIPLSLNAGWRHSRALRAALADFPRCIVLLSHMARPPLTDRRSLNAYFRAMASLAQLECVHVKLSGFYAFVRDGWRYPQTRLAETVRRLKDTFGAERLLWGSDFAPVLEHNTFCQALHIVEDIASDFTSVEMDRIYRRNAERITKERTGNEQ